MPPVTAGRTCRSGWFDPCSLLVAVRAGLAVDLVGVLRVLQGEPLVDGGRMPRRHVTALAEERQLRLTSMRSLLLPCESWHVVQLSTTGACSQRKGPRFSVWQLVQLWSTVVAVRSSLTFTEPCTLWHDAHVHLAFANRHVVEALLLVGDGLVAARAGELLGLRAHQRRPLARVHAVAVDALDVAVLVLAAVPQRVLASVVAGLALRVGLRSPRPSAN